MKKRVRNNQAHSTERVCLKFTEAMTARLKELGMSHYRLSKLSGVSKGQISRTFGDGSNLTIETMVKMAMAVGMTVAITLKREQK